MKRVAVITGAAGGIGAAAVSAFRSAGWYVVALDRREPPDRDFSDRHIRVDLADVSAIQNAFQEFSDISHVDALVNGAAVQLTKAIVDTTPEEWDMVIGSNLRSAFLTMRACYPIMRGTSSAIVNVASVHAVATSPGLGIYAVSKGGLLALTRAAALEFAQDDIRVNAVLPGAIDTAMLRTGLLRFSTEEGLESAMASLSSRTPLGRIGKPEEVAEAILFLADERRSGFMTGQTLIVDGGATARLSTE